MHIIQKIHEKDVLVIYFKTSLFDMISLAFHNRNKKYRAIQNDAILCGPVLFMRLIGNL